MRKRTLQITLPNLNFALLCKLGLIVFVLLLSAGAFYWRKSIYPYYRIQAALCAPTREIRSDDLGLLAGTVLREGDFFRKGDLLFSLDGGKKAPAEGQFNSKLSAAKKKLDQLHFLLEEKTDQYLYLEKELGSHSTSDVLSEILSEMQALQKQATQNESELQALKMEASQLQSKLENQMALAPFDGVVLKRLVDPGEKVREGSSVLLVSQNQVSVEANVPETLLSKLHVDQTATLELPSFPGQVWHAKICWISPTASNGNIVIRLAAESLPFKPGLTANVSIKIR